MKRRIIIIGGGLAGLAAAVRLCRLDCAPIIIETRKKLGGRATSFLHPKTNSVLDNCQHVLMGCCTNLIDLYDRVGALERIQWHDTLYWTDGKHGIDRFRRGFLPAPLHFLGTFYRMRIYTRLQKRAIARCMWRVIRLGEKGRIQWTNRTFKEFLETCSQPDDVVKQFWEPIVVSACNLSVDRVGAAYALQVFQRGFLANKWSYTMGLSAVPLSELYDPVQAIIEEHGGEIHLGCSARSIAFNGSRITGVVTDDNMIEGSAVIAAVPPDRLEKLISDPLRRADPRLQRLNEIEFSPILGVHLFFDQPIMDLPHVVLAGFHTHWLFNKQTDEYGRQHIHAVISGASQWMDLNENQIVDRVMHDIHRAFPKTVGLQPIETRSVKEKRATFAALPGFEELRPTAARGAVGIGGGGVENLFLAGDWCDTGWPATMEGAVRSGYAAAEAITGKRCMIDDVPTGLLAYLLGLR